MKKRVLMLLTVAAMMAVMMAVSQAVWAKDTPVGPKQNEHNCGGTSSFNSINDPEYDGGKDYGEFVGDFASSGEDVTTLLPSNCVPQGTWPPSENRPSR